MPTTKDIVEQVLDQHAHIRELFRNAQTAPTTAVKQEAFEHLRRYLAVHETAEELITHPRARACGGDTVVDQRLAEEDDAKETLARLDGMDVDDADFDALLQELEEAVIAHAEAEEADELALLREQLDHDELTDMAVAMEAVEKILQTHPHPGAGSSVRAPLMTGPLNGVLDQVRDAVEEARRG